MPDAWLDAFFQSYVRHRPVSATFIGVHDYDDRLPDLSADGVTALADAADDLLADLPPERPSLDHLLADGFLRIQRWEAASHHFGGNPVHFTGEAIFGVISLLLRGRADSAAPRLHALPALLASAEFDSAPRAWIERARHECTGARLLLEDIAAQFPSLAEAAATAAAAFARFDAHLGHDLVPTEAYACGAEAFDLLLRYAHFSDLDVDSLERLALERIAQEADFLARTPPPEPGPGRVVGDYLEQFQSLWQAACDLARDRDILTVPDWPVRFVERPPWARRAAPYLYFLPYRSPPPLGATPVMDYLVPPGSDAETIKLNHVVHHASWGHHFQNWAAYRSDSPIGRIAAVDCATRIAMLCGGTMAEGWANYAVDLAEEAGLLTPSEAYAQHRTRMRVAARAMVDIRLHHGRMSLEDAAAYYASTVSMPPAAAYAEAVKNSLFPGAACMYLLGWHAIWQLRRELESRLPLKTFHDRLLSFGSVPVSLIARAMLETTTLAAQR